MTIPARMKGVFFAFIVFLAVSTYLSVWKKPIPDIQRDLLSAEKNVVVIVIDTLRADHLPFYSYSRNTAPFLTELANRSTVFDRAFSSSSTTAPATATLFTSLYPSQHGVITGYLATERDRKLSSEVTLNRIPAEIPSLGQLFFEGGYRTYAVNDNLNINREMGFDKGFEHFYTRRYQGADAVNATVLEWESRIKSGGKYLLYLHYMDPHEPYNERSPWFEQNRKSGLRKKDRNAQEQGVIDAYDSEISYVDSKIAELFERFGWLENAIVLVTSDHGEEFWDHGRRGHGRTLYREVTQVPLFIYHPAINQPQRVPANTHLIDVLPTLAELAELPLHQHWMGTSLVPEILGLKKVNPSRLLFAELLRRPWQEQNEIRSVFLNSWNYLKETNKADMNIDRRSLFNIDDDFGQKNSLLEEEPTLTSAIERSLSDFVEKSQSFGSEPFSIDIDDETFADLKTLGYVE